jgi:hypothetical protein
LPTSRNAKGVDIILYNRDASRRHTIQVKTLTNKVPVPLGMGLDSLQMNDYLIVRTIYANQPEVFIAKPAEITNKIHTGMNERGQISYWFEREEYKQFAGRWEIIRVDGIVLEASSSNDSLTNAE